MEFSKGMLVVSMQVVTKHDNGVRVRCATRGSLRFVGKICSIEMKYTQEDAF
jgi:hypothetical protein